MFALYKNYLLENGIEKEQIVSLNFENPDDNNYNDWKELYNDIKSNLVTNKMNYIFLDEIQVVKEFEKLV